MKAREWMKHWIMKKIRESENDEEEMKVEQWINVAQWMKIGNWMKVGEWIKRWAVNES